MCCRAEACLLARGHHKHPPIANAKGRVGCEYVLSHVPSAPSWRPFNLSAARIAKLSLFVDRMMVIFVPDCQSPNEKEVPGISALCHTDRPPKGFSRSPLPIQHLKQHHL